MSASRAPILSCAHYFHVPATQASLNTTLHSCFFSNINRFAYFDLGKFVLPTIEKTVIFRNSFQQITFKLCSFFRRSFQWCRWIFSNLLMSKVEKKKREKVYPPRYPGTLYYYKSLQLISFKRPW